METKLLQCKRKINEEYFAELLILVKEYKSLALEGFHQRDLIAEINEKTDIIINKIES